MTINGYTTNYMGLRVISSKGHMDMPARKGPTYHDWGDSLEPLVSAYDIEFEPRVFNFELLRDPRILNALDMDEVIDVLNETDSSNRSYVSFSSDQYDTSTYIGYINDVTAYKRYRGGAERISFSFEIPTSVFFSQLRPTSSDTEYQIGSPSVETDFSQFGIVVRGVTGTKGLAPLLSNVRLFYYVGGDVKYRSHREFQQITMKCSFIDRYFPNTINYFETFRKKLSDPGLKSVIIGGQQFDVFVTDGFKATRRSVGGVSVFDFDLILNVVP